MQDKPPLPVAIAADHAGVALKRHLKTMLEAEGRAVLDLGTHGDASVDYPDFADALATAIKDGKAGVGVLVCGSGIGISIAANRHRHLRCALVRSPDDARLAREHNDANVLALGARTTDESTAAECLRVFLATPFAGGRHAGRVEKLC